jgi:hypothetical protein
MTTSITPSGQIPNNDDYDPLLRGMQTRFQHLVVGGAPLYHTDAKNLWEIYLSAFGTPEQRQHHTCNTCCHFIERFGDLVLIESDGNVIPAIWPRLASVHPLYGKPIEALWEAVRKAKVIGVFLSSQQMLGTPETGPWHHFSVRLPHANLYRGRLKDAEQMMAEKKQDYLQMITALQEFSLDNLNELVRILDADVLSRSEKFMAPAKWLRDLQEARQATKDNRVRANLLWRAVAMAPAGFCHPRTSVIGTLLEDIEAGLPFETVKRKFNEKIHPLQYQRPQAAPDEGTIKQAEDAVKKLGIVQSLRRRWARMSDILEALWRPRVPAETEKVNDEVFGHLRKQNQKKTEPIALPPVKMTWVKFKETVLPGAAHIELYAPHRGNYIALTTAVDPEAPPIIKWDREDRRNPVAWYVYHNGSTAAEFDLTASTWVAVNCLIDKPSSWFFDEMMRSKDPMGQGIILILDGANDKRRNGNNSNALFPEILKSELHGIRSVIEAHSKSTPFEDMDDPLAIAGYALFKDSEWGVTLRVWDAKGASSRVVLDRWD